MGVQLTPFGSKLHNKIGRFSEKGAREAIWNKLLKDNKDGVIHNATGALHYEDHKRMLDDVVAARKYLPTAQAALTSVAGIAVSVSLYDTLVGYQDLNEFTAETSMDGSNRQDNETNYGFNWVPQPIYHCDFNVPWRQTGFGYKQSDGAEEATMQVELLRDKTLILGNDKIVVNVNGIQAPLFGLTNHPAAFTGSTDGNWASITDAITPDAVKMVGDLFKERKAAQLPNSVFMFVANDVWTNLENDYAAAKGDRTIVERIKAISAIRDVLPNQFLPDGAVLLVEASPQTIRIATGTETTVLPWLRASEMDDMRFTVFAASTPQIRQDRNSLTGIAYYTKP